MQQEGVQLAGFLAKARLAVTALFGRAEFELEGRLIPGVDDAEVVGHRPDSFTLKHRSDGRF